jgi:hypothetical protein
MSQVDNKYKSWLSSVVAMHRYGYAHVFSPLLVINIISRSGYFAFNGPNIAWSFDGERGDCVLLFGNAAAISQCVPFVATWLESMAFLK